MLNGSRLYYKTIRCEQNSAFCSVLQGNPTVASPKEQLYEQTTSNPAFTEIQQPIAYLLDELVRMCLACQHFDFNSADWISDNLRVISS